MDSLVGITAKNWWSLLVQNRFAIHPHYWMKAIFVTYKSFRTSVRLRREKRVYDNEISQTQLKKDPIFILGHWRSGTTLIQNLLLLDKQFAFPTVYQCNYPSTFLSIEPIITRLYKDCDSTARPMDDVKVTPMSPGEEEFALAALTLYSPLIAWIFPRREAYYDRYLTFQDIAAEEVEQWKSAFLFYMKKLTYRYDRQLLLKSPPNTARIILLLELFPNAKFIHIHRNPYVVFQSTQRLYEKALSNALMQRPKSNHLARGIIKRYAAMYDAYFEQRKLIPANNFMEIKFEALEQDKIGQVAKIYKHLNISGFETVLPNLTEYVASISDYKKNKHPVIEDSLRAQIATAWQRSFEEWGYEI